MGFTTRPIISFNNTTDTGVDEIPLNSYVYIDDNGAPDNDSKFLLVTSVDGLTGSSTVADLLASSNYQDLITSGIPTRKYELGDEASPVLGGNLDADGNTINNVILYNERQNVSTGTATGSTYTSNFTTNDVIDLTIEATTAITLSVSTITNKRELVLVLRDADAYTVTFTNTINWYLDTAPTFDGSVTILKFSTYDNGATYYCEKPWDTTPGWLIDNASYDSVSLTIGISDTPTGFFFKPDGSRMYIIESGTTDKIYQYDLGTDWDLSTADYATSSVNLATQSSSPTGIYFSPGGDKMFEVSSTTIYQYDLGTDWDLSTADYATNSISLTTTDTLAEGMCISSDGMKLYECGLTGDKIYQWSLDKPWDLENASYDSVSEDAQAAGIKGIFFKPDGTKMFEINTSSNKVYQYDLSTPWDLSTADYATNSVNFTTQGVSAQCIFIKPDGSKLYELDSGTTDKIYQWSL